MQESYESGTATHIGPESCGATRKGSVEALTGERAGRLFSRVRRSLRDADAVRRSGRPHRVHRYREVCQSPARSETPCTYRRTSLDFPTRPKASAAWGEHGTPGSRARCLRNFAAFGERLSSLRIRFVGPSMASEARTRRCDRGAIRGRHRGGLSQQSGCRSVPGGPYGKNEEVPAGTAP
jgi:hypothetical protein